MGSSIVGELFGSESYGVVVEIESLDIPISAVTLGEFVVSVAESEGFSEVCSDIGLDVILIGADLDVIAIDDIGECRLDGLLSCVVGEGGCTPVEFDFTLGDGKMTSVVGDGVVFVYTLILDDDGGRAGIDVIGESDIVGGWGNDLTVDEKFYRRSLWLTIIGTIWRTDLDFREIDHTLCDGKRTGLGGDVIIVEVGIVLSLASEVIWF